MSERRWLYKKVVFAGTFDHLHEGHRHLLRTALRIGEKVSIGLTTDKMLEQKSEQEHIQSYKERESELQAFLQKESNSNQFSIFPIDTKEGGADRMEDLEALVVSDEIKVVNNAFEINELRAANGLSRFHIIVVPRIRTRDGRPLSSSRRRHGEDFKRDEIVF
ncbi:MAG: pantetheine-phosphate adenylyltransferase [Candidatus Thorarchaeota archaeon]